jgi:hypothetical protein
MTRLALCTCIVLTALSLSACNRDKASTPTSKPDTITPAPVRPNDATSPTVPGPSTTPTPTPDVNKK